MKILLIADTCIDVSHYGSVNSLSPEAPIPILLNPIRTEKYGMGFNVENNFFALGNNISTQRIFNSPYNTEINRYIDEKSGQQLLRVDNIEESPELDMFDYNLEGYDVCVVIDYGSGFITQNVLKKLVEASNKYGVEIVIDTKKRDLSAFVDCKQHTIKVNEKEYNDLYRNVELDSLNIIKTVGERGAYYNNEFFEQRRKVNPKDVCGCGETFLASFVYARYNGMDIPTSMDFANLAASITAEHDGVYAPSSKDVMFLSQKTGKIGE